MFEFDKSKYKGICVPYARFSTKGQSKVGRKSLERQLSKAREYAEQHNLYINDELIFADKGVSGWSMQGQLSKAFKKGQMSVMLEMLEQVPPFERQDVYITFHNFDRFSRMSPDNAQKHFNQILNKGFKIVTTIDNQLYERKDQGLSNMIISIIKMTTAWHESQVKSIYIHDALSRKKKIIEYLYTHPSQKGKHKHIGVVQPSIPRWIEQENITYAYVDENGSKQVDTFKKFSLSKKKAKIVQYIFELKKSGLGYIRICQKLNNEEIDVFDQGKFKKAKKWHPYAVQNIITSESALGHITLKKMVSEEYHCEETDEIKTRKIKQNATEKLHNYYPAVIDEETFRLVNEAKISEKKGKPLGRIGERTNIFADIIVCYCTANFQYSRSLIKQKSKIPKYREQLRCTNALVKKHCNDDYVNYVELENAFFKYVNNIDFKGICLQGGETNKNEIKNIQSEITQSKKRIVELKNSMKGLKITFESAVSQGIDATTVLKLMNENENETTLLNERISNLNIKIDKLNLTNEIDEDEFFDIINYSEKIKHSTIETKIVMRKKINDFLKGKIRWMELCSSKHSKFVILCFHDNKIRTFSYSSNYASDLMFNTIDIDYGQLNADENYQLFVKYLDVIRRSLRGQTSVVTNRELIQFLSEVKNNFYEQLELKNV